MRDPHTERSAPSTTPVNDPSGEVGAPEATVTKPHPRERRNWRLVIGLAGLLGVTWAVAIASRYPNVLPG